MKESVLQIAPWRRDWNGVAGSSVEELSVTAVMDDGSEVVLEQSYEREIACSYDGPYKRVAPSCAEQVANLPGTCVALKCRYRFERTYGNYDEEDEQWVEEIHPLDISKIRRRIEDRLRKADKATVISVALSLGIRLT